LRLVKIGALQLGRNDDGLLKLHLAEACSVQLGRNEDGSLQLRLIEIGSLQLRLVQLRLAKIGPLQLRLAKIGALQLCLPEVGALQLPPVKVGPLQLGTREDGPLQLGHPEDGVLPAQVGTGQISSEVIPPSLVLGCQPFLVLFKNASQLLVRKLPQFGFGGGGLRRLVRCVVHRDPRGRSGVRLTVACHTAMWPKRVVASSASDE
jgi:hypothetical protein